MPLNSMFFQYTLPESNSKFTLENGCLEYDRFLLGPGLCSGSFGLLVSGGIGHWRSVYSIASITLGTGKNDLEQEH